VADELKGEVPLGLVVLKKGVGRSDEVIVAELIQLVREKIGIVRGTIKKIADGAEYRVPPTIEDATVLDEITINLNTLGYPRS
jgi:propionyl-CoA synthetase